jgi:hypothetical protein
MKKTWKGIYVWNELLLDSKTIIKLGSLPKEKCVFGKTSDTTKRQCFPGFVRVSPGLTLMRMSVMITVDNGEAFVISIGQKRTYM